MTFRIDDVHAIRLIANASQIEFVPKLHHCIARYSESDKLLGGVLFTGYRVGSVMIHMAGFDPHWVNKAMVYLAFDYPFNQLKCRKLIGMVPERNVVSVNNTLHLGFKIEYLAPDILGYPDGVNGMYFMSMYKEDCKWLKMKMPFIEFASQERTNSIADIPLALIPHVGMVQ
jgi:hypothetical protein